MNIHAGELANLILKKSLHQCSVEELQQLVQQYPYFSPAHLLLTKKLQEDNSSLYEEQVQNTSLYFQNRLWLHHLLNDNGNTAVAIEKQIPAEEHQFSEPLIITENKKEEELTIRSDHEEIAEQIEIPVETSVETPAIKTEPFVPAFTNENNEIPTVSEPIKEEAKETSLPFEMPSLKTEPFVPSFAKEDSEIPPVVEPIKEETGLPAEAPILKIEPVTTDAVLLFEPYHTVDYFASQGIKYREEEKPKDRFSVQLKSFTEWLKTMRRVPASEIVATTDTGNEKKVEQMAEFSLAERHVITEAMAEVWKKQGNKAKAEDIYNKLSLLDPSKRSYFAAKIDELKKTS